MEPTMPSLYAIAVIGQRRQLVTPADTPWFREMTWGKVVIAGGASVASIPPLPGRHIKRAHWFGPPSRLRQHVREAQENIFLIGGAETFAKFACVVDRWYIDKTSFDGPSDEWFNPMWLVAEGS
jgi:dihydrofolate reductase